MTRSYVLRLTTLGPSFTSFKTTSCVALLSSLSVTGSTYSPALFVSNRTVTRSFSLSGLPVAGHRVVLSGFSGICSGPALPSDRSWPDIQYDFRLSIFFASDLIVLTLASTCFPDSSRSYSRLDSSIIRPTAVSDAPICFAAIARASTLVSCSWPRAFLSSILAR